MSEDNAHNNGGADNPVPNDEPTTPTRADLSFEPLESRILRSATWYDVASGNPIAAATADADQYVGTDGADVADGLDGDDILEGLEGDDTLTGGAGDDLLRGGAGRDTASYVDAPAGVQVDLTLGTATGGAGTDTLEGIEAAVGSSHDDVFAFAAPADGATYRVDGNGGDNTVDLSNFSLANTTFADSKLTIDLGGGQSFAVEYTNIGTLRFADGDATVLAGDHSDAAFAGSGVYVDGAQAFRIELLGGGSMQWSYTAASDSLDIASTAGTAAGTTLRIEDLDGQDLHVGQLTLRDDLGAIESNVDIDTLRLDNGVSLRELNIGAGSGRVEHLSITGDLAGSALDIAADIGTLDIGDDVEAALTIDGTVDTLAVGDDIKGATVHVTGDVGTFTVGDRIWQDAGATASRVQIDGNVGTFSVTNDIAEKTTVDIGGRIDTFSLSGMLSSDSEMTVAGDAGSVTIDDLAGTLTVDGSAGSVTITNDLAGALTVHGDLDTLSAGSVSGSLTVEQLTGKLTINDSGTEITPDYDGVTHLVYDGATKQVTVVDTNAVPVGKDGAATIDAGTDAKIVLQATDADADADIIEYRIDKLPVGGTLTLSGVPVGAGAIIDAADISAGRLGYAADTNWSGTTVIEFSASDGKDWSSVPATYTLTVTAPATEAQAPDTKATAPATPTATPPAPAPVAPPPKSIGAPEEAVPVTPDKTGGPTPTPVDKDPGDTTPADPGNKPPSEVTPTPVDPDPNPEEGGTPSITPGAPIDTGVPSAGPSIKPTDPQDADDKNDKVDRDERDTDDKLTAERDDDTNEAVRADSKEREDRGEETDERDGRDVFETPSVIAQPRGIGADRSGSTTGPEAETADRADERATDDFDAIDGVPRTDTERGGQGLDADTLIPEPVQVVSGPGASRTIDWSTPETAVADVDATESADAHRRATATDQAHDEQAAADLSDEAAVTDAPAIAGGSPGGEATGAVVASGFIADTPGRQVTPRRIAPAAQGTRTFDGDDHAVLADLAGEGADLMAADTAESSSPISAKPETQPITAGRPGQQLHELFATSDMEQSDLLVTTAPSDHDAAPSPAAEDGLAELRDRDDRELEELRQLSLADESNQKGLVTGLWGMLWGWLRSFDRDDRGSANDTAPPR